MGHVVIAEYERAKVIERTRRGRRHAAQQGSVSALVQAPYGYRYRGRADGVDPPHLGKLRQGLARLIDSYTDGLISKEEFLPRVTRLRQRIAQFEEGMQREREEANALREVRLVMGQLESFATQVRE